MNEWMQRECEARLVGSGLSAVVPLAQSQRANSYLLGFGAKRGGSRVFAAFNFELEDGDAIEVGWAELACVDPPVPDGNPWVAMGGWPDLDADTRVLVGQVADPSLSECRVVSPVGSMSIPMSAGVVLGWVPEGLPLHYVFA